LTGILNLYIVDRYLAPQICAAGDDAQYGPGVEHDVYTTIQAISRKVHYGPKYVGETKYLSDPATF
jgi:hypothetical protein